MVLLAGLIGVLIGISLGSLGGGGSILAVPALVYVLDRPIQEAVPTSLLVVAVTSAAGAISHLRAGRIPWRTASVFAFTGVGGSLLGAYVNHRLSEDLVLLGFVVLMAGAATAMLRRAGVEQSAVDEGVFNDPWRERLTVLLGAGAGVGFLTGLFGVAGGIVIVPTLVLVLDFSMRTAVGTSLLIVVINSAAGFLAHRGYGASTPGSQRPSC